MLLHHLDRSIDGNLCIQRIKDGLDKDGVNTTLQHGFHLFAIGCEQGIVSQLAGCRITHVGAHRAGLGGRTDTAADKAWLVGRGESISHLTGNARSLVSHLTGKRLHVVVGLADALTAERVRGNHVGTGHQVFPVDILDDIRACQVQDIVVSLHLERRKRRNRLAQVVSPEIIFLKTVRLNHGTHGTIENQNPFLDTIFDTGLHVISHSPISSRGPSHVCPPSPSAWRVYRIVSYRGRGLYPPSPYPCRR